MEAIRGIPVELADKAHRKEQACELEHGPDDSGYSQAKEPERVGKRQSPRWVAHDENCDGLQAFAMLQSGDGIAVVRIAMERELVACGPIADEDARTV